MTTNSELMRDGKNDGNDSVPLVSVVMPVYNGETYLAEAIESILEQTFTDFEFLIVDDGSLDMSAEIIKDYATRDGRIRLLQHRVNRGKADARNTGMAAARGGYVAMMDGDDVCLPERLQRQVDFLDSNADVGIVGVCGQIVNRELSKAIVEFNVPSQHPLIVLVSFIGYGFIGASIMLRGDVLHAVGGYEPGRRVNADLELFSRLFHSTHIRCANLGDKLYLCRRHDQLKFRNPSTEEDVGERKIKKRNLELLWNEAPEPTMDRLYRLRLRSRLSWAERRAAKKDMRRLIESMIVHKWVEPDDKPLLIAEMNTRLEQASPRRWQQFCHWRRHRFPRKSE